MRLYGDIEERALAKLHFTDRCWEWTGYRNADGYGRVRIGGVSQFVHRAIMEWVVGRRLSRFEIIDHLCRNHSCARPSHLEIVTPSENTRRGWAARLSSEAAEKVCKRRKQGIGLMQLAREFGIHYTTVIKICQRHKTNIRFTRRSKKAHQELFP